MTARHQAEPGHLFHFSEDPAIERFVPHVPETNPAQPPMVWTIDDDHAPLFWFPRDCPRITYWSEAGPRVHAMEAGWVERMRTCRLFMYRFAPAAFRPWLGADGYWVSETEVGALDVEPGGRPVRSAPPARHRVARGPRSTTGAGRRARVGRSVLDVPNGQHESGA